MCIFVVLMVDILILIGIRTCRGRSQDGVEDKLVVCLNIVSRHNLMAWQRVLPNIWNYSNKVVLLQKKYFGNSFIDSINTL